MGAVLFWKKWTDPKFDLYDDHNDYLTDWLTKPCELLQKVLDFIHPRIQYVKIDHYDTWGMDSTLAVIILPMLKDIRASKCGAPCTDDKDVPKHLRSTSAPPKENPWDTDALWFDRWNWILDEMIFAFESIVHDNWEDPFFTGMDGPKEGRKWDKKGYMKVEKRIQNGLTLFGKYYRSLWT
jgi:hypothetical protein